MIQSAISLFSLCPSFLEIPRQCRESSSGNLHDLSRLSSRVRQSCRRRMSVIIGRGFLSVRACAFRSGLCIRQPTFRFFPSTFCQCSLLFA